jgi:hypothetical protein
MVGFDQDHSNLIVVDDLAVFVFPALPGRHIGEVIMIMHPDVQEDFRYAPTRAVVRYWRCRGSRRIVRDDADGSPTSVQPARISVARMWQPAPAPACRLCDDLATAQCW